MTGGDVVPWAFCIARRLWIDGHRKTSREVLDADPAADSEAPPSWSPEDEARGLEAARIYQAALARLPEPQRVAFELTKLDGLSVAEAADVLGTTETAIKLRVHRTHVLLRSASQSDSALLRSEGSP